MPKVSVIVPVYNVQKYIRQCLDSLLVQTFKDIEIICIDDGSTDKCGQILDEYASKDGRVKVYIETPDLKDGFHNATCYLPDYTWEDINGYSDVEINYFKQLIRNNAHLIIEFSKEGGILNASNF